MHANLEVKSDGFFDAASMLAALSVCRNVCKRPFV